MSPWTRPWLPSVILIETAGVCETVAAEYSVSGSQGLDRLPVAADGFTKGWIGVPPHEKRTARTTSQYNDRDNQDSQTDSSTKSNEEKRPCQASARTVRAKNRQEALDTQGSFREGKTRKGAFTIKRRSIAKRMRAKLQEVKQQLTRQMHRTTTAVGAWLRSVVRGWFNYHAVPGNRQCLDQFRTQVARLWLHVVRRRSQKGRRWIWERMTRLIHRWLPKAHILHPYPNERLIVNNPR